MDWLITWGVGQATWSVFRPILEDLAKDVAKDAAKSYVGKCFQRVFSVIPDPRPPRLRGSPTMPCRRRRS